MAVILSQRILEAVPLACPNARFAAVWLDDVATAMLRSIDDERTFERIRLS